MISIVTRKRLEDLEYLETLYENNEQRYNKIFDELCGKEEEIKELKATIKKLKTNKKAKCKKCKKCGRNYKKC